MITILHIMNFTRNEMNMLLLVGKYQPNSTQVQALYLQRYLNLRKPSNVHMYVHIFIFIIGTSTISILQNNILQKDIEIFFIYKT